MAEILVRVIDSDADPLSSKAGDVICICADGHPWSQAERTEDYWRIVSVPLDPTTIDALIASRQNATDSARTKFRDQGIDFTKLPAAVRNAMTGPRQQAIYTVTKTQMLAAIAKKL